MNKIYNCKICGLYQSEAPWGIDGKSPSFSDCICCGVEFGNQDWRQESIVRFRNNWLKKGAKWILESEKPKNWNLESQLKNIN